jgi:hypothetical protein
MVHLRKYGPDLVVGIGMYGWGSRGRRFKSGRPDWSEACSDSERASGEPNGEPFCCDPAMARAARRGYGDDSIYFDEVKQRRSGSAI